MGNCFLCAVECPGTQSSEEIVPLGTTWAMEWRCSRITVPTATSTATKFSSTSLMTPSIPPAVTTSSPTASPATSSRCCLLRFICGRISKNQKITTMAISGNRPASGDPCCWAALCAMALEIRKSMGLPQVWFDIQALASVVTTGGRKPAIIAQLGAPNHISGPRAGTALIFARSTRPAQAPFLPACRSRLLLPSRPQAISNVLKATLLNGLAQRVHQLQVVMQIVNGGQPVPENLVAAVEVAQIGARKIAAGIAAAVRIHRPGVPGVAGVANSEHAAAGKQMPVAGIAGGHYAIEHVDAALHAVQKVFGPPHAHQVARPVLRQQRTGGFQHGVALVCGLAHAQAADGVAVKANNLQPFGGTLAQVRIHAALDNAEQRRRVAPVGLFRSFSPAQGQLHGLTGLFFSGRVRRAFVKNHDDVRAQRTLYFHGLFRPKKHPGSVNRRRKSHAFRADLASFGQAEHLTPARIGQYGPVPGAEILQVTVGFNHFNARPEQEVNGVATHEFRP